MCNEKAMNATQKRVLDLLRETTGIPLSIERIRQLTDISSKSVVHHHIKQLQKKGYITKERNTKYYHVNEIQEPQSDIVEIPFFNALTTKHDGSIHMSAVLLGFPSEEAFAIKAPDYSMHPYMDRYDFVILQRTAIVESAGVYLLTHKKESLIRNVTLSPGGVILTATSHGIPPTFVRRNEVSIKGKVKIVLAYNNGFYSRH
jgi:repressor LexA